MISEDFIEIPNRFIAMKEALNIGIRENLKVFILGKSSETINKNYL